MHTQPSHLVSCPNGGSPAQQSPQRIQPPLQGRQVQGGEAHIVGGVGVGPGRQQHLHHGRVAPGARVVQRRAGELLIHMHTQGGR